MVWVYVGLGFVALAMAALAVGVVWQVEDWSRDFSTNTAATDERSGDERLRPIRSGRGKAAMAELALDAASGLARWELVEQNESGGIIQLYFVRATPLWRFKDDIRVSIAPAKGGGSLLTAQSRSRVGKGDLGQNPRNLRELLGAIRAAERP